jgi:hypothetical protein
MKSLVLVCTTFLGFALAWAPAAIARDTDKEMRVGDTAFIAYEGPQNWPDGRSAMVIKDYAVPIYRGLPDTGYRVLGRIYDKRTAGFDVIVRGFDEAFGKEKYRLRACANQAKLHGADAVLVTDDERVLGAFGLSKKELRRTAPLFGDKDRIVLAIRLR